MLSRFIDEVPSAPVTSFTPSPYQVAIHDWFREGDGNLIVRALAGTGKSTTIIGGIAQAPESNILLCAHNKRIQEVLQQKLGDAGSTTATAKTLHSVGYTAIRNSDLSRAWSRVAEKRFDREDWLATQVTVGAPWGAKRLVAKLVTKVRELLPLLHLEHDPTFAVLDIAADFDLLPEPGAFSSAWLAGQVLKALELAAESDEGVEATGIDYADMIYLPLRLGLLVPQYDMVVVDEAQDMSASQLLIARGVCHNFGRMVIVGDSNQAIYGFRGADSGSLDRMKIELRAAELPLSKTYRCPKLVVALAQKLVPAFEVDATAPEGIVDTINSIDAVVQGAEPGDFVLSRTNAPLARVAMGLLRAKKRAKIQGRDIGAGLTAIVKKLATGDAAKSIPAFLRKLLVWEEKQCERLAAMGREDRCDNTRDQAMTLRALLIDLEGVGGLAARIDYLFTDNTAEAVVCSTVHKAKGLEAKRVYLLRSTFFLPVGCQCGHRHRTTSCKRCACTKFVADAAKVQEEKNLWYVSLTRAMKHLTMVEEIV